MKKKGHTPVTKVKNPEPNINDPDWVIWAAWADRITFEEIEKKTGIAEYGVIKIMRRSLKYSSFKLWRKRTKQKSIKHRKKFEYLRKEINIALDESKLNEMLKKSNGKKTIPQIFIEDFHVGGYEELRALENKGKLDNLVK